MTGRQDERAALTALLHAQRHSVLAIVEGLDERAMRRSVTPSDWTPLGMIEHLGNAEHFWFQQVIGATAEPPSRPGTEADAGGGPFVSSHPVHEVLAFYREQVRRSNEILADTPLDSRPAGRIPPDMVDEIHTARDVVLHMVEEVARHAGHLEIARELLDGRTGLGPR